MLFKSCSKSLESGEPGPGVPLRHVLRAGILIIILVAENSVLSISVLVSPLCEAPRQLLLFSSLCLVSAILIFTLRPETLS